MFDNGPDVRQRATRPTQWRRAVSFGRRRSAVNERPAEENPLDWLRRGLAARVVDVVAPFVQPVVDAVDVGEVVDRIDIDELIGRIDVNELLDRVDIDALISRIDVNELLDRVDPDRLLDRVDPDRLLQRVDVDAVIGRIDVDAVMGRVDVNSLVSRTELGEVIARSTTGVFGQLLDEARIAVMSLDLTVHGLVARALRRSDPTTQSGPGGIDDQAQVWRLSRQDRAVALQGRYAGAVSRFLAFLVDVALASTVGSVIGALFVFALRVVTNITWDAADHRVLVALAYTAWQFLYFAGLTAVAGRTVGKALLGVYVVRSDGADITPGGACLRTAAFPLSFLLLGAGFVLGLVRRDRRQLHDLIAATAVVYAWDAETARLRARPLPVRSADRQPGAEE